MTKKQCIAKIKRMVKDDRKYLIEECERLLRGGGIDISTEDKESFAKAKAVYHVAINNLGYQRQPLSDEGRKDVKNLKYF
jgi:hypothetical protein